MAICRPEGVKYFNPGHRPGSQNTIKDKSPERAAYYRITKQCTKKCEICNDRGSVKILLPFRACNSLFYHIQERCPWLKYLTPLGY